MLAGFHPQFCMLKLLGDLPICTISKWLSNPHCMTQEANIWHAGTLSDLNGCSVEEPRSNLLGCVLVAFHPMFCILNLFVSWSIFTLLKWLPKFCPAHQINNDLGGPNLVCGSLSTYSFACWFFLAFLPFQMWCHNYKEVTPGYLKWHHDDRKWSAINRKLVGETGSDVIINR